MNFKTATKVVSALLTFSTVNNAYAAEKPISHIKSFNSETAPFEINKVVHNPIKTNLFYTSSVNGMIHGWDEENENPLWATSIFTNQKEKILDGFSISNDGKILIAVGSLDTIVVIDAFTGEILDKNYSSKNVSPLPIIPNHLVVALANNNQTFATGDANGNVYLWQLGQQQALGYIKIGDFPLFHLKFTQDDQSIVAGNNQAISIWNLNNQEKVFDINENLEHKDGLAWIQNIHLPTFENFIIINTFKNTIILDLASKQVLKRYPSKPADNPADRTDEPLLSITDSNLQYLWRFNRSPTVQQIDVESGDVLQRYRDPTILSENGSFQISSFTNASLKPGTLNEFIAVSIVFSFTSSTGEPLISSQIRKYSFDL